MLRTICRSLLILALAAFAVTQAQAMSSPAIVNQTAGNRIVVFQTGWGGLWDWYWDGAQWIQAEEQGAPSGTTLSSAPAAVYQSSVDRVVAFVIAENGRLYAKYWAGTHWQWQDLSNPGVRLTGSPSAVYFQSVNQVIVFAVGVDGHLYNKMWNIASGEWEDRSPVGASGTILVTGSPSAVYKDGPNQVSVFVTSIGHSLFNFTWDGTDWRWQHLGFPPHTIVQGDPSAIYRVSQDRFYAFVLGANGMLYDVAMDGQTATWEAQDYPAGTVAVGSPSAVYETVHDGIAVFVEGADGGVYVRRMKSPPRPSSRDRVIFPPPAGPTPPINMQPILRDAWSWTNLGLPMGTAKAEKAPAGLCYTKSGGLIVFVQAQMHLYDAYEIGSTWYWEDQGWSPDVHQIDNGSDGYPVKE